MSQVIAFADLMLALRHSVCAAAKRLTEANEKILEQYFDEGTQNPKSISITAAAVAVEMKVPLLAMAPLTAFGINSASFKITLPLFAKDGQLWVGFPQCATNAIQATQVPVNLCINPNEQLDEFLRVVKGLEQEFLATIR